MEFDIILENSKSNYIVYFLLLDDEIVYIGSSKAGLTRAYNHNNICFERVGVIYCNETNYKQLESEYIIKYKPKYNKRVIGGAISLQGAKTRLKKTINPNFNMRLLKNIIKTLSIETFDVNDIFYISNDDYIKILKFVGEMNNVNMQGKQK